MTLKITKFNIPLIKNLSHSMRLKLILLDDVIPDEIMSTIYYHDSIYKKERHNFLNYRDDIRQKMYEFRGKRKYLYSQGNFNAGTDENIQFIKKYPKFKQLIESIDYVDDDFNIVKVVPIDEYLAEN